MVNNIGKEIKNKFNDLFTFNPKEVPVSVFYCVSIIIVFLLYISNVIKSIPCGKDMKHVFMTNFIHIDFEHLLANLFGLYSLSRVERNMGTKPFFFLVLYLLIVSSVIESIIHKIFKNIPCSIGFSGVLFGVMTYEIIKTKKINIFLVGSILLNLIPEKKIYL